MVNKSCYIDKTFSDLTTIRYTTSLNFYSLEFSYNGPTLLKVKYSDRILYKHYIIVFDYDSIYDLIKEGLYNYGE